MVNFRLRCVLIHRHDRLVVRIRVRSAQGQIPSVFFGPTELPKHAGIHPVLDLFRVEVRIQVLALRVGGENCLACVV